MFKLTVVNGCIDLVEQRKQLTSFDVSVLCSELKNELKGYYIENIYHPEHLSILLRLNKPISTEKHLLVEAGRRIHLTSYAIKKPSKPSTFCSSLRKYLINGIVKDVEQPNFERIIIFHIVKGSNKFKLVFELFSKGNIILVDGEEKILHALTYRKMKDRSIIPREHFKLPPSSSLNPENLYADELFKHLTGSKGEVVRVLTRLLGVGGVYIEEILKLASIQKNLDCSLLGIEDFKRIHKALMILLEKRNELHPCIVYSSGEPIDFLPFPLSIYDEYEFKFYPTFNEVLDEYFTGLTLKEQKIRKKEVFLSQLNEQKRILEEQVEKLKKVEAEAENCKKIGDHIFAFSSELQTLLNWIIKAKDGLKDWVKVSEEILHKKSLGEKPFVYFKSLNLKDKVLEVDVENLTFSLDIEKGVYQSASLYYEKAKELRGKALKLKAAIEETKKRIEELEKSVLITELKKEEPVKLVDKKWFEKYRFFFSSEGFLVVSGKDASSNEAIIKHYVEQSDLILHADTPGSPFTVVKTAGKTPSEKTIYEAAQFTACYSKAWREGFSSIDVYYVNPEQVKKTAPSGEYLTKGSFMIVGIRNYVKNVPLKLKIGVTFEDDKVKVHVAPPSAIESITKYFVEISPGDEDAKAVALKAKKMLAELVPKEFKDKVLSLSLEEIRSQIPFGKAFILSRRIPE
ncbi:MAG: ribosome rescue protein RqcH [Candidatus Bathyarchaeota archaeon]|nr:ribosome rescue protein RqcH [Candidatus Bathyarchaeota archaeon]